MPADDMAGNASMILVLESMLLWNKHCLRVPATLRSDALAHYAKARGVQAQARVLREIFAAAEHNRSVDIAAIPSAVYLGES